MYKIPSRNHITNTCIPALYPQVKSQVEKELANAERMAITTDAWTSCATESYLTITAHHIAPDWKLNVHVLQTRAFKGSHTGNNIGALLKQACIALTDNAINIVLAGVEAEMNHHLMCFAHTINLATQKAFKVDTAARLLARVRKVIGFFSPQCQGSRNSSRQTETTGLAYPQTHPRCVHKMLDMLPKTFPKTCLNAYWNNSLPFVLHSCPGISEEEKRITFLRTKTSAMLSS